MKQKVAKMCEDLKAVLTEAGEDCTVFYQMLDANFFLAKSDEGGLLPVCKLILGDYHVDGELDFSPKELQYSIFCTAKPLLEVASPRRIILLTPIPRFLLTSCCSNPEHVSNMKDERYRRDQEAAVVECRKNVKDFCFRHVIRNIRVDSPWTTVKEIGDGVWSDPVHLTEAGYVATAELLLKVASELASKPEAIVTPIYKRPRDNDDMYGGGGGDGGGDGGHSGPSARPHHYWSVGGRGRR